MIIYKPASPADADRLRMLLNGHPDGPVSDDPG